MRLKTFPLMISKQFLKSHPRAGEKTYFREKIELALQNKIRIISTVQVDALRRIHTVDLSEESGKIHTIRGNYDHWARIANEVNAGRGVLSLRQWTGSPYNFQRDGSKPKEFLRLPKMGVQRVNIYKVGNMVLRVDLPELNQSGRQYFGSIPMRENLMVPPFHLDFARKICMNDGLNDYDFKHWFDEPIDNGAIIHFTDFRYGTNNG